MVDNALGKLLPQVFIVTLAGNLLVQLFKAFTEDVIGLFATGKADDSQARRQVAVSGEVIQSRNQFPVRQIAGGAENHKNAGLRVIAQTQIGLSKRVVFHCGIYQQN